MKQFAVENPPPRFRSLPPWRAMRSTNQRCHCGNRRDHFHHTGTSGPGGYVESDFLPRSQFLRQQAGFKKEALRVSAERLTFGVRRPYRIGDGNASRYLPCKTRSLIVKQH